MREIEEIEETPKQGEIEEIEETPYQKPLSKTPSKNTPSKNTAPTGPGRTYQITN